MKKSIKQTLALILVCAVCFSLVCTGTWAKETEFNMNETLIADETSGQQLKYTGECGDNLKYDFKNGILTISGTGEMSNYIYPTSTPWYNFRESISAVILEYGITHIGNYAFSGCINLSELRIPESVTSLGVYIIADTKISSLRIPKSVTTCWNSTVPPDRGANGPLAGAMNLVEVVFDDEIGEVPSAICASGMNRKDESEKYDSAITTVVIPDSAKGIGFYAFNDCTELKRVDIPQNIEYIGDYAFYDCSGLSEIYFYGDAPDFYTDVFGNVNAIAYYPEGNSTWTETVKQNYGGKITWRSWNADWLMEENYYVIGKDTNQFVHSGLNFKMSDDHNDEYMAQLSNDANWIGEINIWRQLNQYKNEIGGVCQGIALSTIYASQGLLDYKSIKTGATSYWALGGYYNNSNFKDLLIYYNLTQYTTNGGATENVKREGWFGSNEDQLTEFLSQFVKESKKSQLQGKPFVFGYNYEGGGHSLVVCGYNYNESAMQPHEIKIYDPNDYDYEENSENIRYCIMKISKDFSSFSFQDKNLRTQKVYLEENWTAMRFWSIDDVFNSIHQVNVSHNSISTKNATLEKQVSDPRLLKDNVTELSITYGEPFYLENSEGQYLSYDGTDYLGNMEVYNCDLVGGENIPAWHLTVDASDSFVLKNARNAFTFAVMINKQGYSVSTGGAEYTEITEHGITIKGDSPSFNVNISSSLENCLMYSMTGQSKGSVSFSVADNKIDISSENGCRDFCLKKYIGFNPLNIETDSSFNQISISGEKDGTIIDGDYIPDNPKDTDTPEKPENPNQSSDTETSDKPVDDSNIDKEEPFVDSSKKEAPNNVQTGDDKQLVLWYASLVLIGSGLTVLLFRKYYYKYLI